MTASPDVLVRLLTGHVGPAGPEDGHLVRLDASTADELVRRGDAVRASDFPAGAIKNFRGLGQVTAPASIGHETKEAL